VVLLHVKWPGQALAHRVRSGQLQSPVEVGFASWASALLSTPHPERLDSEAETFGRRKGTQLPHFILFYFIF
jgi:hypothetical protein